MDLENLTRMANRIGEFFAATDDRDEAIEGIATHIARFWEPRMRRQILALLDLPNGLTPLVREALQANTVRLTPAVP